MSIDHVAQFSQGLPLRLRDDVIGYARSVHDALPEIFRDAGFTQDARLGDQLVLIAGIRKLHAICSAAFWILDNSLAALKMTNIAQVKMGSLVVARGSPEWRKLRETVSSLETLLTKQNLMEFLTLPYSEILGRLRHGR